MESNGGLICMIPAYPEGGSNFNFTVVAGWGGEVKLDRDFTLRLGLRFTHMSNGYIYGHDRNPAYDGFGGYFGLVYRLNQDGKWPEPKKKLKIKT
jgi:hypothetical protein